MSDTLAAKCSTFYQLHIYFVCCLMLSSERVVDSFILNWKQLQIKKKIEVVMMMKCQSSQQLQTTR